MIVWPVRVADLKYVVQAHVLVWLMGVLDPCHLLVGQPGLVYGVPKLHTLQAVLVLG